MSIIDHAKDELKRQGASDEYVTLMVGTLENYFDRYDSGGAVAATASMFTGQLHRLIAAKPLSPLTGADDEWMEVGAGCNGSACFQNVRCGSVFKEVSAAGEVIAYDIDGAGPGRTPVTFPYMPERAEVRMPIFEIEAS